MTAVDGTIVSATIPRTCRLSTTRPPPYPGSPEQKPEGEEDLLDGHHQSFEVVDETGDAYRVDRPCAEAAAEAGGAAAAAAAAQPPARAELGCGFTDVSPCQEHDREGLLVDSAPEGSVDSTRHSTVSV